MKVRGRGRSDEGAIAVEFALILPIFLVFVFAIIQYGWYFYAMQQGTSATGDALRRLSVGTCTNQTNRDALIVGDMGGAMSGGTITTDSVVYRDSTNAVVTTPAVGNSVTLTVSFPTMNLKFPLVPAPNGGTVTRTQTARVEVSTTTGTC